MSDSVGGATGADSPFPRLVDASPRAGLNRPPGSTWSDGMECSFAMIRPGLVVVALLAVMTAHVPATLAAEPADLATANATASEADQFARIPSMAWREAAEAVKKGPVLVQVARPGYSPCHVLETDLSDSTRRCLRGLRLAVRGLPARCGHRPDR